MSGMNPGFAAYLANKKAKKSVASKLAPTNSPAIGLMPMMAQPIKGAPKGKRHAKIMHVSTANKSH